MELSEPTMAFFKLLAVCLTLMVLLRFHLPLWGTIGCGCIEVAAFSGIGPTAWPGIVFGVLGNGDFLLLCLMITFIMLLSSIQDATGQSKRFVAGLERYLAHPRWRLLFFPALVGLLPMPGGALFSCPMIQAASEGLEISNDRKALINYWFRHIWEAVWPLYPGYALICALLQIPLTQYVRYTFPLFFLAFAVGYFFYLRDLTVTQKPQSRDADYPEKAANLGEQAVAMKNANLGEVLLNALPLILTLIGAAFFGLIFDIFFPKIPGQAAFSFSLALAIAVALWQGRGTLSQPLAAIVFKKETARMLLLLLALFVFKDTIHHAGIVKAFSHIGVNVFVILLTFVGLPFISGILTGIMVGFVGMCFPILIGLVQAVPILQEHMIALIVLAMVSGNCGQLLSPLHVCLVVTGEYFNINLAEMYRRIAAPLGLIFVGGCLWALLLYFFNPHL